MSQEKERHEAERWIETAEEDLDAARKLIETQKYSHACFLAQQCGEKALKALWYAIGEDPWGHSIQKLIMEMPDVAMRERMEALIEAGSALDRYYIPTRYPNGLPDLTPGKCYFLKDAEQSVEFAGRILAQVRDWMERA
jgi:HEPN domain-containing protein